MADIDDQRLFLVNKYAAKGFSTRTGSAVPRGLPPTFTTANAANWSAQFITEMFNRMGGWVH